MWSVPETRVLCLSAGPMPLVNTTATLERTLACSVHVRIYMWVWGACRGVWGACRGVWGGGGGVWGTHVGGIGAHVGSNIAFCQVRNK